MLEYLSYIKNYSEILILSEYINYEISINDISSFENENYRVIIEENNNSVRYSIIVNRNSFFRCGKLKKIKYDGIVH